MFKYLSIVGFPTLLLSIVGAAPLDLDPVSHLSEFGYLPPPDPNKPSSLITDQALANAIRSYQEFMGLKVTGTLDSETSGQMQQPRCGMVDLEQTPQNNPNSPNSFTLFGTRWSKKQLKYKITKYPSNFSREKTDSAIRRAFDVWSSVTPLTFVKKNSGPVHIEIRFERGHHNEICKPFDGPSHVLAHAYQPSSNPIGGDAHFDDTENWTLDSSKGKDLFLVAAHELGHSLGLRHSKKKRALMYPTYHGFGSHFELHPDDIKGIQTLYPR
ncbi:collagenase 3-like [Macrosteles quadrilineatus]|uniref:collagenase 3-like n=1 Tax=Macrosteles quadrilineatus TaxID=74068 RepID=UPI0023E31403|nr:collagenase 3-like [Macrosteles quadrilineatus]